MKKSIVFILLSVFTSSQIIFSQETQEENQEQHQILTDKFHFDVGLFFLSKNVKVGANGTSSNQNIDFGKTFKLNNDESAFFLNLIGVFLKNGKCLLKLSVYLHQEQLY